MIQTLIFDLSEVLIHGLVGVERSLAPALGLDDRDVLRALGGDDLQALCSGKISGNEYLRRVISREGWDIDPATITSLVRANLEIEVPGMNDLLERVPRRYELVLLSDHAVEWIAHIRARHAFLDRFNRIFFSFELGQTKSNPTTFTRVLELLDRRPQECLFIDDNPGNVARAASVGMHALLFTGAGQLQKALEELGVFA